MSKARRYITATALLLILFVSGCSKYAPTPEVQKRKIVEFTINTAANISSNYYYYIAFETNETLSSEGPLPYLYGVERAKNWTYYIRLYNGYFSEKMIASDADKDDDPTLFNSESSRYFQAYYSGSTIHISVYLDKLTTVDTIAFNIISSEVPLTPTDTYIPALDYFIQPKVTISTTAGAYAYSSLYTLSSSHTVSDTTKKAADITSWTAEVYEK